MKKFISKSSNILAFSLTFDVTGSAAALDENAAGNAGEAKAAETKPVTKEYAISRGNVVELPEDNEYVKGLITKKLIEEVIEEPAPAEQPTPPAQNTDHDQDEH